MLVSSDGTTSGMVSGGCLETDLAERARAVLREGSARTVVYDMRSPDDIVWGLGLGCDGEVRVLLERIAPEEPPEWCRFAVAARENRNAAAIATIFESDDQALVGKRCWAAANGDGGGSTGSDDLDAGLQTSARECLEDGRLYS